MKRILALALLTLSGALAQAQQSTLTGSSSTYTNSDFFWITNTAGANSISNRYGAGVRIGANNMFLAELTASATITASTFSGNGGGITDLDAGNISAGTLALARMDTDRFWITNSSAANSVSNRYGAGVTVSASDVTVATEAYDATGWNGDLSVPTKDAVRDKIETMAGGAFIPATNAVIGWGNSTASNYIAIHPGGVTLSNGVYTAAMESFSHTTPSGQLLYSHTPTAWDFRLSGDLNVWDGTVNIQKFSVNDQTSFVIANDTAPTLNSVYGLIVGTGSETDRVNSTNSLQIGSPILNDDFAFRFSTNGHFYARSNIVSGGTITAGSGSSSAGSFTMNEGTAPSLTANMFSIYSPTDVAAGGLAFVLPAAAFSGPVQVVNSSGVMTLSQATAISADTLSVTNGYFIPTNGVNTGVFAVGPYYTTNVTGNITLGGVTGLTAGKVASITWAVTNGSGGNTTVTMANGFVGPDGAAKPPVAYATNLTWTHFQANALLGVFTNVSWRTF